MGVGTIGARHPVVLRNLRLRLRKHRKHDLLPCNLVYGAYHVSYRGLRCAMFLRLENLGLFSLQNTHWHDLIRMSVPGHMYVY